MQEKRQTGIIPELDRASRHTTSDYEYFRSFEGSVWKSKANRAVVFGLITVSIYLRWTGSSI
jgi:hypothetical protein